ARLTDAGLAADQRDAAATARGAVETVQKRAKLTPTPDKRRAARWHQSAISAARERPAARVEDVRRDPAASGNLVGWREAGRLVEEREGATMLAAGREIRQRPPGLIHNALEGRPGEGPGEIVV